MTFFSHNEEGGYWERLKASADAYAAYRTDLIAKVELLTAHNATLNWESDRSALEAMLQF